MSYIGSIYFVLDVAILFILVVIVLLLWDNKRRSKRIDKLFGRLNEIKIN